MSVPRTAAEIREAFLRYFEGLGHERLPSDSLVPSNDPTLLFTGAGMNQFKDEFLGRGRPGLKRATTVQKCLRVPDLENVGRTPRHHTFFEMLGNFSFGDYFKAETIPWEWEFFTGVLGWDPDRLLVTVYQDDDEAWRIWKEAVGLPEERIYRFGEKENFWPASAPSQGPDGPCGPCSEIYFDLRPEAGALPPQEGLEALPDRFLEVGNFVFTQFDRQPDGRLAPLPQKNIDVGLGLERIAAVAQDVPNNFETDLFRPTLEALQRLGGRRYGEDPEADVRMRRIADHARAVFFCIADGAAPGREGRGYVVRKILRRAVRDGIELGLERPFLAGLLPAVQETLAEAWPELREQEGPIQVLVEAEEERFREVWHRGIHRLEALLEELGGPGRTPVFPGRAAFELHDTWGFPRDIVEVVVREKGYAFDAEGFEAAMEEQRRRARQGSGLQGEVFAESLGARLQAAGVPETAFTGYEEDASEGRILALVRGGELVEALAAGEEGAVLLDRSPFYAEGGGQVGDRGRFLGPGGELLFEVEDTRAEEGRHLHFGHARMRLEPGLEVRAELDAGARRSTEAHHTATHLLHAALRRVLGEHVTQAGSLVAPDRLRFDYTHPEAPSREQLEEVERLVQAEILAARPVCKERTRLEEARARGVMALFGEKYGEEVRVVEVPGFSAELCGGTHVSNTGQIGLFRILSDRALAAGVRRIEAVAGWPAVDSVRREHELLLESAALVKTEPARLPERIGRLRQELKEARSRRKPAAALDPAAVAEALRRGPDAPAFGWQHLPGADAGALRSVADRLRQERDLPRVVLLVGEGERFPFAFLRTGEGAPPAGELARAFGSLLGGGGGGRPDFAQGQAVRSEGLEAAVARIREQVGAPA